MKSRFLSVFFLVVLLVSIALPVHAEQAAAGISITLKIGSAQMTVNGKTSKAAAPYQTGGTVMLPLTVATKAIGAKLTLQNDKTITLVYLKHTVVITKNNKAATFDGRKVTLAAAPSVKNGVTMIPLKVFEGLGAKVVFNAAKKEIRITAAAGAASDEESSGIDSDAGKSKIGDSNYQWSMNYPTGLVQTGQSDNGDDIVFEDVKGDYYLEVSVEEAAETLTSEEKRERLTDEAFGTVVDVKTVTQSTYTYEKVVAKNGSGFFYEYRGYQANGNFYYLTYGKKAKSVSELASNASLLDSFQTSFDKTNNALKDLTKIKDGMISFENEDYGLKLDLPKDWRQSKRESSPYFSGPDESYLLTKANSLKTGDSLDAWVERKLRLYKDTRAAGYLKEPEISRITWNGVAAKLVKLSFSNDTRSWLDEYELYAVNGNYKYYVEFEYKQEQKDKLSGLWDKIQNGMKIDFTKVEKTFGDIPDPDDSINLADLVTKTSKTNGYSVTMPKLWADGIRDMEQNTIEFKGIGISLLITIEKNMSLEGYPEMLEKMFTGTGTLKLNQKTNSTLAGVSAVKFIFETVKAASNPGKATVYLFESKGNIFLVQGILTDAFASELQIKQLDDAINSFKLN